MTHWRLISYSLISSVVLTALALWLKDFMGSSFLSPGIIAELGVNVLLMGGDNEEWYSAPAGSYILFNIIFYALGLYFLMLIIRDATAR